MRRKATVENSITNLQYLNNNFEELEYPIFYRYLFPAGAFENKGEYEKNKPNGILIYRDNGKMHKRLVFDDLDELYEILDKKTDCFISPIAYVGRTNKKVNARKMYALAFDIDYLRLREGDEGHYFCAIEKFIECMFEETSIYKFRMPKPNLLVQSSDGHLHFYYCFDEPLDCYGKNLEQLQKIKNNMTVNFWRSEFIDTDNHTIEYESVVQNFRIVGSINTKHGNRIHGFIYRKQKYKNLESLLNEIYEIQKLVGWDNIFEKDFGFKPYQPKGISKSGIKIKSTNQQVWKIKPDLYNWYLKYFLTERAIEGGRYWRCFVLSSIAYNCGIEKKQLKSDLRKLMEWLNETHEESNPFTWEDVESALKAYSPDYVKVTIDFVNKHCKCTNLVKHNSKRNKKPTPQKLHLAKARASLSVMNQFTGHALQGRKSKKELVQEWRTNNPTGRKVDCERELKLSKHTILKWWDCE